MKGIMTKSKYKKGLDWVGMISGNNKQLAEKRMKYHQPSLRGYKMKLFRVEGIRHRSSGYTYDVYMVLVNHKWVKTQNNQKKKRK
jgi:hypothetical protein